MPRYIDADDAIYELERAFPADDYGKIIRCISRTPTTDVVERKVGKWLKAYGDHEAFGVRPFYRYCSECNESTVWTYNFCPHCGADMRG